MKKSYSSIDKKIGSEPVHGDNEKKIETKIVIWRQNTNFKGKKVLKENAS